MISYTEAQLVFFVSFKPTFFTSNTVSILYSHLCDHYTEACEVAQAPGWAGFSSSIFKCLLGLLKQGDQSESSTSAAGPFQGQKVFPTAYTPPDAAGSPDDIEARNTDTSVTLSQAKIHFSILKMMGIFQ